MASPKETGKKTWIGKVFKIIGIIAVILVIAVAVLITIALIPDKPAVSCTDASCFIDAANKCSKANFTEEGVYGKIEYISEKIDGECTFTKTIIQANPAESEEMRT